MKGQIDRLRPDEELMWAAELRAHMAELALLLDFAGIGLRVAMNRLGKGHLLLMGVDVGVRAHRIELRFRRVAEAQLGVSREIQAYQFQLVNLFGAKYAPQAAYWVAESRTRPMKSALLEMDFATSGAVQVYAKALRSHMAGLSAEMEGRSRTLRGRVIRQAARDPGKRAAVALAQATLLRARARRAARGQHLVALEVVRGWHEFREGLPQTKKK